MINDVKVKIDLTKPIGSVGLGVPLILEGSATADITYVECASLAEVVKAGYADSTKTYKMANAVFMQDNPPAKIAVCSTTTSVIDWLNETDNVTKDWRQLLIASSSEVGDTSTIAAVAAKIETLESKMYFADGDYTKISTATSPNCARTVLVYGTNGEYPAAALVGRTAGLAAGSYTYKNLILKGVTPLKLTATELNTVHSKNALAIVEKAGDIVTSEGKTTSGEYIDIIDSRDYVVLNLEYKTQKTLNTMDKIPYDNGGIAILESVAISVMKDAYNSGIIATNEDGTPAYAVNYAKRENTEASDRAARKYLGGQFAFSLAGAIHEVEITGEIII